MERSPAKRRKRNTTLPPSPTAAASDHSDAPIRAVAPAVHIGPPAAAAVASSSSSPVSSRSNVRKRRTPRQRAGSGASGESDTDGGAIGSAGSAAAACDEDEEAEEEQQRLRDEEMYDDDGSGGGDDDTESDGEPAAHTVVSATSSAKSPSIRCESFPKGFSERALYTPLDAHIFFHAPSEFEHYARAALDLEASYSLPARMSRPEWAVLRRAMGPVRRLGPAFLREQRLWLQHQRAALRTKQREAHAEEQSHSNMRAIDAATAPLLDPPGSSGDSEHEPTPPVLPAGTAVFVLHPTEIGLAPAIVLDAVEVQESSDAFRSTQRRRKAAVQLPASDSTSSPAAAAVAATSNKSLTSLNSAAAVAALSCTSSKASSTGSAAAAAPRLLYRLRFDHAPLAAPAFATDTQLFLRPHHPANQGVLSCGDSSLLDPPAREILIAQHLRAEMLGQWGALPATAAPVAASALHTAFMHGPGDVRLVCELLQLIDRKKLLVEQLALMNEAAEIMRAHPVAADDADGIDTSTTAVSATATGAAPTGPVLTVDAALTQTPAHSSLTPMQIDGDMPALEGPSGATAASAAAAASTVAADSSAPARVDTPTPDLTPLQFASAYDQFGRQYAWVVLQLESTSRALDSALQRLRVRRAAARRQEAARASAPSGALFTLDGVKHEAGVATDNSLRHDAARLVQSTVREMLASGALARSSALAARDSDVQHIVSHAITLVIMLQVRNAHDHGNQQRVETASTDTLTD